MRYWYIKAKTILISDIKCHKSKKKTNFNLLEIETDLQEIEIVPERFQIVIARILRGVIEGFFFFLLKCLVFDPLLFDFDANNLPQIETALSEIETALLEIEIVSELFQIVLAGI